MYITSLASNILLELVYAISIVLFMLLYLVYNKKKKGSHYEKSIVIN